MNGAVPPLPDGVPSVAVYARRRPKLSPLRLSPHGIAIYRECPRHYRYQYIDKLAEKFRRAKAHFTMASHVHATLRDFLTLVPEEARSLETLEKLLQQNWQRFRHGFKTRENERRWAQRALEQLQAFVSLHDMLAQPFMVEVSLEAEITPGLVLHGRIDRVDREADGTLHIIDYKTGNMPDELDWTQLYLYALVISKRLPYSVSKLSYIYLASGWVGTADIDWGQLLQARWDLLVTAAHIQAERDYLPAAGEACRRCDFSTICADCRGEPGLLRGTEGLFLPQNSLW